MDLFKAQPIRKENKHRELFWFSTRMIFVAKISHALPTDMLIFMYNSLFEIMLPRIFLAGFRLNDIVTNILKLV